MKRTIIAVLGATALLTPAIIAAQTVQRATFDDVFEWTGTLVLEERDEALNAGPILEPDPRGGWIVHDRPENQV